MSATRQERLRRVRVSDVLVKFAVQELNLLIVGRSRWGAPCPVCRQVTAREDWKNHKCSGGKDTRLPKQPVTPSG